MQRDSSEDAQSGVSIGDSRGVVVRRGRSTGLRGTRSTPGDQRPATAADVARVAQVSIATVSLVANHQGAGRVSHATRERVEATIDRLGYRVDGIARSLATGRRNTVALVAHDMTNPFFSHVAMGVATSLGPEYQLLLVAAEFGSDSLLRSVERVLALRVDGILIDSPGADLVRRLHPTCPVVVLDAPGSDSVEPRVDFDIPGGANELAQHLLGLGHTRIAYLDAAGDEPTFRMRRACLQDGLGASGASIPVTAASQISMEAATQMVHGCWPAWRRARVTALVCATDVQAYGALRAVREIGVHVPGDLSLASFDDLPFAEVVDPPLTAVSLSGFDLGYASASLLRQISEGNTGLQTRVVLPVSLHVRGSSGPRPLQRAGSGRPRMATEARPGQ